MDYLSSFKKLAGVESRLPSLPKTERRRTPDPLPVKITDRKLSDEDRRLAGIVRPQMRGAVDLKTEDVHSTFALKRGVAKPAKPKPVDPPEHTHTPSAAPHAAANKPHVSQLNKKPGAARKWESWQPHPEGGYERSTSKGPARLRKGKKGWTLTHAGKTHSLPKKASFDHADRLVHEAEGEN